MKQPSFCINNSETVLRLNLKKVKRIIFIIILILMIIPMFKKGYSVTSSNYRPISLLSVFTKIIEN